MLISFQRHKCLVAIFVPCATLSSHFLPDTHISESELGSDGQPPAMARIVLGVKGRAQGPIDMTILVNPGSNQHPSNRSHRGFDQYAT